MTARVPGFMACAAALVGLASLAFAPAAGATEFGDDADDGAIATVLLDDTAGDLQAPTLETVASAPRRRPRSGSRWMSVGLGSGPVQWDAQLADYQWDVRPRFGWSANAFAGIGRLGLGVRVFEARTRQDRGEEMAPLTVIARSSELAGRAALVSLHGADLVGIASVGRLHVAWNPRHTTLAAPGAPVEVDFAPIDAWVYGFGAGIERPLGGPWVGRIALERRAFGWDTAHRSGDAIEVGRESFGNWSARFEVDWLRLGR